ncbi:nuclease domain-containing protein [Thermoanaerobacterium sp. RBIITD]|uniref:nuclease domain-containing protein n=1 Tax=Thermoanaerobacterium sp. RBIITD TaxID=1550240 RepID=UPI001E517805|nr:nuclease domain-containing protein [Thermoanaerobacterium sp. RBIITD]
MTYNNKYDKTATVAQKPDNALSLEKKGSNVKYNYIFEAKYRICYDNDYLKKYFTPGPEEDDINTMHRYRDAIVYENKDNQNFERMFFGAFVLFPYSKEDEYRNHQFYKSIEKVSVGGLPFLPNATKLVEDLLDDVINDSPETTFENTIFQSGTYEYLEKINFNSKEVLVGFLHSRKQLEINLRYKFYHIPYSEIKSSLQYFKYVAIIQTKAMGFNDEAGIRYYGKIKRFEVLKRSEIKR